MKINIVRNNQYFGPYDESALLAYVNAGQILLQDKAIAVGDATEHTVKHFLKSANLKPRRQHKGNVFSQLKAIGSELLFPHTTLFSKSFLLDSRFLIFVLVGLLPMIFMLIPQREGFFFIEICLYFAIIWGLFFYNIFKTPQVKLRISLSVFFITPICMFIIWDCLGLPSLNPFYEFAEAPFPQNMIGYIFGVGFTEELCKAIPLLIVLYYAKEPLIPQTIVFYGLISGIAFGVYEGVEYQTHMNLRQFEIGMQEDIMGAYAINFYANILRLTSLPFVHACWCGMTGYFLSFANLYPKYRIGLYFLAFTIPALIHGLYDSVTGIFPVISLLILFLGVTLLMVYLKQTVNYQSKLRN